MRKYMRIRLTEAQRDSLRLSLSVFDHKLSAEPVCDFDGNPEPVWVYASLKMSTGENRLCWRWLACEQCAREIEANNFRSIADRIAHWLIHRNPTIKVADATAAAKASLQTFIMYAALED